MGIRDAIEPFLTWIKGLHNQMAAIGLGANSNDLYHLCLLFIISLIHSCNLKRLTRFETGINASLKLRIVLPPSKKRFPLIGNVVSPFHFAR